jgi:integrase
MPSGAAVIRYAGKRGTTWRIKYVDAAGEQIMETLGREPEWNRRKAERELRHRLSDVERKGLRRPAPLTFGEYAETWLEEAKRRRDWRPRTVTVNEGALARVRPFFAHYKLAAIRPRHVAEFIRSALAEYAPATVNLDVNVLVDIFNSAVREEVVETNPAQHVERPRIPRRRWRILQPAEVARISKAFSEEQDRAVFLTLVLTGIRRSELLALRWRDVDLLEGVLRVADSKTEDGIRSIALPSTLTTELHEQYKRTPYRGGDEYVFADLERGTPFSPDRFRWALKAAQDRAGVEGRIRAFHDLRHTAITNDAAAGSSAIAVMTKAGHSDMKTTKHYLHLAGVVFRDEAEALERRLLGEVSTAVSTDLASPEHTEQT